MRILSHKKNLLASVEFSENFIRYLEIDTSKTGGKQIQFLSEVPYKWDSGKFLMSDKAQQVLENLISGKKSNVVIKRKNKTRAFSLSIVLPDTSVVGNIAQIEPSMERDTIKEEITRNIKKIVPVSGPQVIDFDIVPESRQAFVFSSNAELINKIIGYFSELEFNIARIEPRAHALRSILSQKDATLLIDGKETTASLSVWDSGYLQFLSSTKFEAFETDKDPKNKGELTSAVFEDFFGEIVKLSKFFKREYKVFWTGALPFQLVLEERIKKTLPGKKLERFDVSKYFDNWPKGVLPDIYIGLIGGILTHFLESPFALLPPEAPNMVKDIYQKHLLAFAKKTIITLGIALLILGGSAFYGTKLLLGSLGSQKIALEEKFDVAKGNGVEQRNALITFAGSISAKEKKWSKVINVIVVNAGPNVLTEITQGVEPNILLVRGISPRRDALLDYENRLNAQKTEIKSATIDSASFKTGTNLTFLIEIEINPGAIR